MAIIRVIDLQGRHKINKPSVRNAAVRALRWLEERDAEINIVFVDNRKIRSLNRAYRKKDAATDVLTFNMAPHYSTRGAGGKDGLKGDIVISAEKASANARRFKVPVKDEISTYVAHGILHLSGYGDYTKKDFLNMDRIQKEILG